MFKTPSGSPASISNSANLFAKSGVRSDGFKTNVFPVTIAIGNIQQGTIIGKLNGVIPPITPIGYRYTPESSPLAIEGNCSPIINVGAPDANSRSEERRVGKECSCRGSVSH